MFFFNLSNTVYQRSDIKEKHVSKEVPETSDEIKRCRTVLIERVPARIPADSFALLCGYGSSLHVTFFKQAALSPGSCLLKDEAGKNCCTPPPKMQKRV